MADNVFGFAKKYADKPNGQVYNLGTDPNNDTRLICNQEIINNGDGSFRLPDDNSGRIVILTSALFNEDLINDNHSELDIDEGGRGYMMAATDWRDIELDFAFYLHDYTDEDGITFIVGGGRHVNPKPFCEGCAYRFKLYYNGDCEMLKEQWHKNDVPVPQGVTKNAMSNLRGSWTYLKFCRYNFANNDGTTSVKLEVYINLNGDKKTWTLLYSVHDVSNWGNDGEECEGKKDQVLNWAYPMIAIDWENATRLDWNSLSIREIQPTATIPEDPDDNGQPDIPPPEQPTGMVAKMLSIRFPIASTLATSCDGVSPPSPPQDPPPVNPPPDPPAGGGVITIKMTEYFKIGS